MALTINFDPSSLQSWLGIASEHIHRGRSARATQPKPKRNRERERARREARALFREYEAELALNQALTLTENTPSHRDQPQSARAA